MMSELRKVFITSLVNEEGKLCDETGIQVGDLVKFLYSSSTGVVVEIIDKKTAVVLWSDFRNPFLDTFGVPRDRINYSQLAKQMFPVQPMPLPNGLVFYLDEAEKRAQGDE